MRRLLRGAIIALGAVCVLLCAQLAVYAVTVGDNCDGAAVPYASYNNLAVVPGRLSDRLGTLCPDDSVMAAGSLAGGSVTYTISGSGRVYIGVYAYLSLGAAPTSLSQYDFVPASSTLSSARSGAAINLNSCRPLYLVNGSVFTKGGDGAAYELFFDSTLDDYAFQKAPGVTLPANPQPYGVAVSAARSGDFAPLSVTAVSAHIYNTYTYYQLAADIPPGTAQVRVALNDYATLRSSSGSYANESSNGLYLGSVRFEGSFTMSSGTAVSGSTNSSAVSSSTHSSSYTLSGYSSSSSSSSSSSREILSYDSHSSSRSSNTLVVPAPSTSTALPSASSSAADSTGSRRSSSSSRKQSSSSGSSRSSAVSTASSRSSAPPAASSGGQSAASAGASVAGEEMNAAALEGAAVTVRSEQAQTQWFGLVYMICAVLLLAVILCRDRIVQVLRKKPAPPPE